MSTLTILGIAFGLSMDAFAVSVTTGCSAKSLSRRYIITLPLFLGAFQAGMPVVGWLLGTAFGRHIEAWDHWIAFGLLAVVGAKMVVEGLQDLQRGGCADPDLESLSLRRMLSLSVATSIDALAVGVSLSVISVSIAFPVVVIGVTTLVVCVVGVYAGRVLQSLVREWAEIAGGLVLVTLGTRILVQHLVSL